ncbi:MAG: aspartyl protease family protein [Paludibacteraceae bacterium]
MTAYTHIDKAGTRRLLVECKVAILGNDIDQEEKVRALWDTGAMCTCISESLAERLGLKPDDFGKVNGANNQPFDVPVYSVQLKMGHFALPFLRVVGLPMGGQEHDVIIGMDVMTKGDLSITNCDGKTILTFREPSIEQIDYVKDLRRYSALHQAWQKTGNNECPCGSGRLWQNCHGKKS